MSCKFVLLHLVQVHGSTKLACCGTVCTADAQNRQTNSVWKLSRPGANGNSMFGAKKGGSDGGREGGIVKKSTHSLGT